MALAACGTPPPASVAGGECKVFSDELARACGLTDADQLVIDAGAEAGFRACPNWQRPAPRHPTCEAVRLEIETLRNAAAGGRPAAAPRKPTLRERLRNAVR